VSLILGTFLFSIASALIPVLNAEVYLAAIPHSQDRALWLAIVAGTGQTIGKIIWYYAGIHSMRISWLARKMETAKWQASYQKWHQRIVGRPVLAGAICFASAFSGFPPLAIIAVLAGSLRMSFVVFVITCLIGRILRFWLVLEGADWLKDVIPHLFG
jgi:membrane protein YqaA with SNARE-associated domain